MSEVPLDLLAVGFAIIVASTGRDFGPMAVFTPSMQPLPRVICAHHFGALWSGQVDGSVPHAQRVNLTIVGEPGCLYPLLAVGFAIIIIIIIIINILFITLTSIP